MIVNFEYLTKYSLMILHESIVQKNLLNLPFLSFKLFISLVQYIIHDKMYHGSINLIKC